MSLLVAMTTLVGSIHASQQIEMKGSSSLRTICTQKKKKKSKNNKKVKKESGPRPDNDWMLIALNSLKKTLKICRRNLSTNKAKQF